MDRSKSPVRYTDRHKGRGAEYHDTFSPEVNPYRAMVWRLEQRAVEAALRDYVPAGRPTHLDFACGTGRILEFFAGRVASSTGVDVSKSMMEVARSSAPDAELIEADLTQQDALGERRFDLITAFRFFPNAEPELREGVFRVLGRHLAPAGVLIFNNHKNRDSLRGRFARLRGRGSATGTMTHAEVERLLPLAGLQDPPHDARGQPAAVGKARAVSGRPGRAAGADPQRVTGDVGRAGRPLRVRARRPGLAQAQSYFSPSQS